MGHEIHPWRDCARRDLPIRYFRTLDGVEVDFVLGDDTLIGGAGDDRLLGGPGRDTVTPGPGETPNAQLTLAVGGAEHQAAAEGSGPVDAIFRAIESIVASGADLMLYSVNAITTGTDAQGEVTVRLARDGRIVNGQGADTDIIVASAKAYLNALNKLHAGVERMNPQTETV